MYLHVKSMCVRIMCIFKEKSDTKSDAAVSVCSIEWFIRNAHYG